MVKRCRMESRVREQRSVMEWFSCNAVMREVMSVKTMTIEVSPCSEFI
jgi:hypothetical protein